MLQVSNMLCKIYANNGTEGTSMSESIVRLHAPYSFYKEAQTATVTPLHQVLLASWVLLIGFALFPWPSAAGSLLSSCP